ncbi:23S rRNA (uracil(1939)-C(5))-methyltransferase RlmD [Paenibacillus agilis]|uniref:23S rRNA (Uracil(1939)-C(5))-methyltransferase RlmD n=1 Tax=Paenibacillus agilis TaxID=3020863 RepID=A0A559IH74_9BACL|nr:23S rRNA (uracil(1939)-C(5))-methyltransferase RlmD [Paenibacillus agilis]TVX86880.1 23S rRNA (uracil(1939)-C(5))-methyltransferase RlmD [Paenibacillus agilis]
MNNQGEKRGQSGRRGQEQAKGRVRNNGGRGRGSSSAASKAVSTAPVQKNDEVTLDIIGLTHEGDGVGRVEGFTLFVEDALPGERIVAHVLKVKKQYGYAKLKQRLTDSVDRVEVTGRPEHYGGCQLEYMSYDAQLRWKQQHVVDVLERIGKFEVSKLTEAEVGTSVGSAAKLGSMEKSEAGSGVEALEANSVIDAEGTETSVKASTKSVQVLPTLGMDNPWRYRNKAQIPIGKDVRTGELIGGYFARASHRIIDTDASLIQHEAMDAAMKTVKEVARQYGVEPYNEETHTGLLRHVVIRYGFHTNEMMIVLVTNGERLPQKEVIVDALVERLPQLKSICQNINTKQTNVIMGDKTKVLWGSETITDYIGDLQFAISARSFYQVNPVQTEVLYEEAVKLAGLTGQETVIDAYCGIGTISLFLAQRAKRVLGVEIVEEAIADARRNAALNGITNAEFAVGASEVVIPQWKSAGITADVIVVDPPRKGCDPALLDTMLEMRPERIVYVSCNPSTLARDLRVLADGGYMVKSVQPVDMFPHTPHVECVVSIYRIDK